MGTRSARLGVKRDAVSERERAFDPYGSRDADGRIVSTFLDPGLPIRGDFGPGWSAAACEAIGREARCIPRFKRSGRAGEPVLRPSWRGSVLRPERGGGHPLRLSRLEVQRGWRMR